jgi:FkbM family methyltransferase
VVIEKGGWFLPDRDGYFSAQIPEGQTVKKNNFQSHHLQVAFDYVRNFRVAVDVGAHVGFWTYDMAQKFKEVHSFEPAVDTFECLEKNVGDMPNVKIYNFALGHKEEKAELCTDANLKRRDNSGARFVMPGRGHTTIRALDSFPWEHLDLLKIDVEGFELAVLKGAEQNIVLHHPCIIMETDKRFSHRYGWQHGTAEKFLLKHGYKEVAHMRPDKVFIVQSV